MSTEHLSEFSLDDVAVLLKDTSPTPLLDRFDTFAGAAIVVGAAASGTPAPLALLGAKNELVRIGRQFLSRLARREDDYLTRYRRMAAAHCLVVYTAFFAAAQEALTALRRSLRLSDAERNEVLVRVADRCSVDLPEADAMSVLATSSGALQLPHPVGSFDDKLDQLRALYNHLTGGLTTFIADLPRWDSVPRSTRQDISALLEELPPLAVEEYKAQYFSLSARFPHFLLWANLQGQDSPQATNARLDAEVRQQLALLRAVTRDLDLGLAKLGAAVRAIPTPSPRADAAKVIAGLERAYENAITSRIIDDRFQAADDQAALTYPKKSEIFVPQAFKVLRAPRSPSALRLEDEAVWSRLETHQNLSAFLLNYFSSPYSTETPLILLGHPGSGKSLLTSMLAARLATPSFNPVRIELRDIDVERELQNQIEDQICRDTGRRIEWASLSESMTDAPPVLLLDGFDELLQASGRVYANFLEKVQQFQRREAVQGRPVRAVVTSRITLIDKARVPQGATVVRLEEFDERRQRKWIEVWNRHNSSYFAETGIKPFEVPRQSAVVELARQPLLLLMLALFDSEANQLRQRRDLDRTLLYDNLLRRFIIRERLKGQSGETFQALDAKQRGAEVEADMRRLGVAAMSMFNRRTLHILRDQLDRDIAFFRLNREVPERYGRALSQAELLLGSFFFVHESRARGGGEPGGEGLDNDGASAFEFLHNTFGEFLTADFVLSTLLKEAQSLALFSSQPQLQSEYERKLSPGGLPDEWFLSLMYAPMYTRPVVLEMIREWSAHALRRTGMRRDTFLSSFDALVQTQLSQLLEGNAPPSVMTSDSKVPYDPLPLLGHYAVYSLNLVLLRAVLGDEPYTFEESILSTHDGGARPWDQLTHLWRSWLSLDNLAGVGTIVDSKRSDGAIEIAVHERFGVQRAGSRLAVVWSAATAIGDTLMSGLSGLHMHDAALWGDHDLQRVEHDLTAEQVDLELEMLLRRIYEEGWRLGDQCDRLGEHGAAAVTLRRVTRSHRDLLNLLVTVDAPARIQQTARSGMRAPDPDYLHLLPAPFTLAHMRFCAFTEPMWARDLIVNLWQSDLAEETRKTVPVVLAAALDLVPSVAVYRSTLDGPRHINRSTVRARLRRLTDAELHPEIRVALIELGIRCGYDKLSADNLQLLTRAEPQRVVAACTPGRVRGLFRLADMPPFAERIGRWLAAAGHPDPSHSNVSLDVDLDWRRLSERYASRYEPPHRRYRMVDLEYWAWVNRPVEQTAATIRFLAEAGIDVSRNPSSHDRSGSLLDRLGIGPAELRRLPAESLIQLAGLVDPHNQDPELRAFRRQLASVHAAITDE